MTESERVRQCPRPEGSGEDREHDTHGLPCDVCKVMTAKVFCQVHDKIFCHKCDVESHDKENGRHQRFAVVEDLTPKLEDWESCLNLWNQPMDCANMDVEMIMEGDSSLPRASTNALATTNTMTEVAALLSANGAELPANITELPANITELPSNITELPSNSTELPSNSTELPSNTADLPANSAELPAKELPLNVTELPSNITELPSNITELPSNIVELRAHVTELPANSAELPENSAELTANSTEETNSRSDQSHLSEQSTGCSLDRAPSPTSHLPELPSDARPEMKASTAQVEQEEAISAPKNMSDVLDCDSNYEQYIVKDADKESSPSASAPPSPARRSVRVRKAPLELDTRPSTLARVK